MGTSWRWIHFFLPSIQRERRAPSSNFRSPTFFAREREYINQEWTEIREGKPGLTPSIFQNSEPVTPRASDERKCCLFSPPPKPQSYFSVHVFCFFSPSNSSFGGLSSRDDFPSDEAAKHNFSSGQDSRLLYLSRSRHRGLHKKVFCDRFRETGRSLFLSLPLLS